jgi:hypothetical protein
VTAAAGPGECTKGSGCQLVYRGPGGGSWFEDPTVLDPALYPEDISSDDDKYEPESQSEDEEEFTEIEEQNRESSASLERSNAGSDGEVGKADDSSEKLRFLV